MVSVLPELVEPEYREFRVTVDDMSTIEISLGEGARLLRNPKPRIPLTPLDARVINVLCGYLATGDITTNEQLRVLGSLMYKALFDQVASRAFKEEVDKVRAKGNAVLRIFLEFGPNASEMAEWPWEYVYYPDDEDNGGGVGFFIAAESQLILARTVPLQIKDLKRVTAPLRILIVKSQPSKFAEGEIELGQISATTVIREIKALNQPDKIEVSEINQPTKRTLAAAIKQLQPHVVHFLGHGKYGFASNKKDRQGFLALGSDEDADELSWVSDLDLSTCFKPAPRLIFLHACEGAQTESYESFRGVALQLVYSRIPAVVAMRYEVENKVANRFAIKFYQALGEGKPIDAAVQEGRKELGLYLEEKNFSSRAFGSPVVFLQSVEGIIAVAEQQGPPPPPDHGVKSIRCIRCDQAWVSPQGRCVCGAEYTQCAACGGWVLKGGANCQTCGHPMALVSTPGSQGQVAGPGQTPKRGEQPPPQISLQGPTQQPTVLGGTSKPFTVDE